MLIEENRGADGFTVTAYGGGALEIGGKIYREPVVLKDGTVGLMDGRKPSDLSAADFFQTASSEEPPEIVLVGTGERQQFLHPKIAAELAVHGIGLECMNTASACRTLMLLQGEGRRVWAWLWP
ncbi:Mth938-like domain-containing protein [Neisseria oralis]|uniref:Mth938-like domain-containing protein n=1 Tax=Neisseria oralis TaxID=1107316 RepID=UPI0027E53704|nr:MTH938/NDUFAF3 family protein [Neisseria oralis]